MPKSVPAPKFVESDNAGREIGYPDGVKEVVFTQFGFQADKPGHGDEFVTRMKSLFGAEDGPVRVERCHGFTHGVHEDILMAYWISVEDYERWARTSEFDQWWSSLPTDGEFGYWREILTPPIDRVAGIFFGLSSEHLVGITGVLGAPPSEKWGYWGGYRDRLTASKDDDFEPELGHQPYTRRTPNTKGRRVVVEAPNNLLFVREGSGVSFVTSQMERDLWDNQVKPALDKWIAYLTNNPELSGALSFRDTIEQDLETGEEIEEFSQLIYFQSLRHLERAARTQPSHVGLYNSYMKALGELAAAGEPADLAVWVEQFLLPKGRLFAEYVNCDPNVGLLPWFDLS